MSFRKCIFMATIAAILLSIGIIFRNDEYMPAAPVLIAIGVLCAIPPFIEFWEWL